MVDFFSNLAKTLQSPQMQSAMMSISGTPFEVQAPILQQQAEMQRMQQAEQAKAMLENLLAEGDLSDEKILQVYTLSPELGNALVKMRESKAEQAMQQQIAGLVGGDNDADTMAKIGVLSGDPQLMQYANMLEDRKYRKGSYGELLNQPDGGVSNAPWTQTGEDTVIAGAAPDMGGNITTSDLPPNIDYTKVTEQDIMRRDGLPNTKEGSEEARRRIQRGLEQQKAAQAQQEMQAQKVKALDDVDTTLQLIDTSLQHEGFQGAVGMKGANYLYGLKDDPFAGSPEAGFNEVFNQIKGRAFLQAYESLRGAQGITEIEGKKATDALNRLSTATSEKEYIKSSQELKDILLKGKQRLLEKGKPMEKQSNTPQINNFEGFSYIGVKNNANP